MGDTVNTESAESGHCLSGKCGVCAQGPGQRMVTHREPPPLLWDGLCAQGPGQRMGMHRDSQGGMVPPPYRSIGGDTNP